MTFRAITEDPQSYNNNAEYNDDALSGESHDTLYLVCSVEKTLPHYNNGVNAHSVVFFRLGVDFSVQNGKEML